MPPRAAATIYGVQARATPDPLTLSISNFPQRRQPAFNAPPGTTWLCVGLVGAFALYKFLPADAQRWLLEHFALIPVLFFAQMKAGGLGPLELLPLVSYSFLHADWMHVLINAAMLLAFGSLIERHLGTVLFLVFFVVAGIAGGLAQLWWTGPEQAIVLGASAGVYGAIGAAVLLLFNTRIAASRRRALIFVAVIMGLNLLFGFVGGGLLSDGATIAWPAHVGGFVAGLAGMAALRGLGRA